MRFPRFAFFAICLFPAAALASGQAESIDSIVAKARVAVGGDDGTWLAMGTSSLHHAKGAFGIRFGPKGCFRADELGEMPQSDGFDGTVCWTEGPSRVPHPLSLFGREVSLISTWATTGQWTDPNLPLNRRLIGADSTKIELELELKDGTVPVSLLLNPITYLPQSVSYQSSSGLESWIFDRFEKWGPITLPSHFIHRSGSQDDQFEITRAGINLSPSHFQSPPNPALSQQAAATDVDIPVKRVAGYTFVRPKINGKDVGWFFLDTGADVMCIDPKVARSLEMAQVGSDTTSGVVGVTILNFSKASTFELGPVKIQNPVFAEFAELSGIGSMLGISVAGICGYDFIARTGLDIDPAKDVIHCFRPGEPNPQAVWSPIVFGSNTPVLQCRFAPGETGEFSIDTGSDSTVDFFSGAVSKYHLLDNRVTHAQISGGAGGTAASHRGPIDWFEIGGKRFDRPDVIFQTTDKGLFSTSFYTGNVGSGFLSHFRLLVDYPDQKIGFVPLPGK